METDVKYRYLSVLARDEGTMRYIDVSGYIRIKAINVILPGFKRYG